MAETVFRKILVEEGVDVSKVHVESAGTHDYQLGNPPFELAVKTAQRRGYEVKARAARPVTPSDFDRFDHILVMDQANLRHLRSICPTRCKQKIELLLEYGEAHHGKEVPDPYGGQPKDYERALDMIEDGCRGLARILRRAE